MNRVKEYSLAHGIATAKEDFDNVPKGVSGMITAYLPDQEIFAVLWLGKDLIQKQPTNPCFLMKDSLLITYKMSEEAFNNVFELSNGENKCQNQT